MPVTRMQQKRGTAAEWASTNPVLADGEIGFERDTGTVKVGNGYDTWANLVPLLRSVLAPTQAEWLANTRILAQGEVAIARDTEVIKIGNGTQTWAQLPSVLASTFVGKTGGDTITAGSATTRGLVIKAAASQTANLLEVLNNSDAVVARVNASGGLVTENRLYVGPGAAAAMPGVAAAAVLSVAANNPGLIVRGATSQTSSLAEFQNSAGTAVTSITSNGNIDMVDATTTLRVGGDVATDSRVHILSTNAARRGLVVKGAASQGANLVEVLDSAGAILARVAASGAIVTNAQIQAYNSNAGQVVSVFRGAASQTANLAEFQNSAGSINAQIAANGEVGCNVFVPGLGMIGVRTIQAGGADTAGTGYRLLRVTN